MYATSSIDSRQMTTTSIAVHWTFMMTFIQYVLVTCKITEGGRQTNYKCIKSLFQFHFITIALHYWTSPTITKGKVKTQGFVRGI